MYEMLTRHIDGLQEGEFGTWFFDTENDGTPEHPIHLPFVIYAENVEHLCDDIYRFIDEYPQYKRYSEILEKNGLEWGMDSMTGADVSDKDGECVIALLLGAVRAERFCDGAWFDFLNNGSVRRWLERLKEIDNQKS